MAAIALVLPAFNLEGMVYNSLEKVRAGTVDFPAHHFIFYPVDDGSTDGTFAEIERYGAGHQLAILPYRNPKNKGLVQTLRETYQRVLTDGLSDYVLKTDLDSDFDQCLVLRWMVPLIDSKTQIVAGVRLRPITREENEYEYDRREDVFRIMRGELGLDDIDPPSAGSQLYSASFLSHLLDHSLIQRYDKRWGFDFLLPLVGRSLGADVPVVHIERGRYDPARRPRDKVREQYDSYIEIMAALLGKNPQELSALYRT